MATVRKSLSELSIQGARMYPHLMPQGGLLWVPSVTTALDVWPKPALVPWAAGSEKTGILDDLQEWLTDNQDANRGAMLNRVLLLRDQPLRYREVSRQAKDIGSSAHAWLEWRIRKDMGVDIGPEPILLPGAERATYAACSWMERVNFKPISVEQKVVDPDTGYGGRYDSKAEVDWQEGLAIERRKVIVDWKSSKGIYPDMIIQNVAYRHADSLTANGDRSKGGIIVRLAKTEDDPVPFEAVQVPYDPAHFETFKAAINFWKMWRRHEGKWEGGYATEEEVAAMTKRSRKGH